jgi:NADP-dependent 3-hydroxy acid dehydrogenase YdfG
MAVLGGKTAVVTGASSGIGKSIAESLAREGAQIYLTGRSADRVKDVAGAIKQAGGKATGEAFDARDATKLQAFVAGAQRETGRLDIMVNAAGLSHPGPIATGTPEKWKEMFDTNVVALLAGCQAAITAMRANKAPGHIVNISSVAGRRDASGVYGATKAAVNSICTSLRQELENDPICIVNVMPGAVATNFARNFPPEFINGFLQSIGQPANFKTGDVLPDSVLRQLNERAKEVLATPEDIAKAVLYAVSQPIELNVFEVVVRPRKTLPIPG